MHKRIAYPIIALCCLIIIAVFYFCWWNGPLTTIILVRHAEKATGQDPPLTTDGHARAGKLAHAVISAEVDAIFVTDRLRTQQTADSAEAYLGLTNIILPEQAIQDLVNEINNNHQGEVILVVGHSHTLPDIIQGLGISQPPPILSNEFDNLFIIHKHRYWNIKLTHLKYGKKS
jgi:broad specificity phosphatase PhoE